MSLYGRIGQFEALPGKGEDLAQILTQIEAMPGCLHYIVATEADSPDNVWITEIWESRDAHEASLELPRVQEAISRGRPLIAAFTVSHEVDPIGEMGVRRDSG